jgi:hypothetical protein
MKLLKLLRTILDNRHLNASVGTMRILQQEKFVLDLLQTERYRNPKHLCRYENQVFSRHGADGIIAEIFKRIGVTNRYFVEIGCGDGLENNTTNLLWCGWSGSWFDGSQDCVIRAARTFARPVDRRRLKIQQAFFTAENVEKILQQAGIPAEVDLLSLDVDRNTYYIWENMGQFRPRVVVIEYNAKVLPSCDWKVDYDAQKTWNGTNYMGASLKALENLGRKLGYCLVGCDLIGADAFFIRGDLDHNLFLGPYTAEQHYEPPRFYLTRNVGHANCFAD